MTKNRLQCGLRMPELIRYAQPEAGEVNRICFADTAERRIRTERNSVRNAESLQGLLLP